MFSLDPHADGERELDFVTGLSNGDRLSAVASTAVDRFGRSSGHGPRLLRGLNCTGWSPTDAVARLDGLNVVGAFAMCADGCGGSCRVDLHSSSASPVMDMSASPVMDTSAMTKAQLKAELDRLEVPYKYYDTLSMLKDALDATLRGEPPELDAGSLERRAAMGRGACKGPECDRHRCDGKRIDCGAPATYVGQGGNRYCAAHKRQFRECTDCKASGVPGAGRAICEHGIRSWYCVDCNACPHGQSKGNCTDCYPNTLCDCPGARKRRRTDCLLCSKHVCVHQKLRKNCLLCSRGLRTVCAHGVWRRHCKICSPSGYIRRLVSTRHRNALREMLNRSKAAAEATGASAPDAALYAKLKSTPKYLGMTEESFFSYITGKLFGGMTWENHGEVWELDHIKPLASFDLTKEEDREKAFHWSNFQPLFKKDNRAKGSKLDWTIPDEAARYKRDDEDDADLCLLPGPTITNVATESGALVVRVAARDDNHVLEYYHRREGEAAAGTWVRADGGAVSLEIEVPGTHVFAARCVDVEMSDALTETTKAVFEHHVPLPALHYVHGQPMRLLDGCMVDAFP